ncbi:MAG: glycosyltransferase family 2 protein [Phycisphaerales bacterium]|nr:glycosyltransferase family 2 protein [Phycisphaerales bacterium]
MCAASADRRSPLNICVVILNYRTPGLVCECLNGLVEQIRQVVHGRIFVVDNGSGDGSAEAIDEQITDQGWCDAAELVRSSRNGGFSAGNNMGVKATDADAYLLLNSDTLVRPGAIERLLEELHAHPEAGLIGPRLEWPDGTPQNSTFNYPTPLTEFLRAAGTGVFDRLLPRHVTAIPVERTPAEVDWVSFAAALIRGSALRDIGLMDEGYFMYFEDIDYGRRARQAGWTVRYCPEARVVHLRGGSSPVKSLAADRKPLPEYWYASRARYYAKYYGRAGLWLANVCWLAGRCVSRCREILERRSPNLPQGQGRAIWRHGWKPLSE